LAGLLVGVALVACDEKKDAPPPAAAAPSAAPAPATPASAPSAPAVAPAAAGHALTFVIDKTSKTAIDMPAPNEHIRADTTAAAGELTVDPSDLTKTRGQVKVDLETLATHTFDDPSKNAGQTEHAHNWLEAGKLVTPEVREQNRWVVYTVESVTGLATNDLSAVPVKDDQRVVDATVKGSFALHGHVVPKEVPVEVVFHYPPGQAASPDRLDIRTKTPLHVVLKEHDVKPRDNFGKLAQWSVGLISKVAETADVTLDLKATATPAAHAPPPSPPPAAAP
jgi:hypothetical protein